jgi:hypothetical protein
MAAPHSHTKLLNAAARDVLGPLGAVQHGRSRTWLDDHGWWLGVVGFQPSGWSRGSYLGVCATFLWHPPDDVEGFPCHFGGRVDVPGVGGFIEYESDEQFAPLARKFAIAAADRLQGLRSLFPTVEATAATLVESFGDGSLLESFDTGIALGLIGDASGAQRMFSGYIEYFESGEELEWQTEIDEARYERMRVLSELVADGDRFRAQIREDVRAARSHLKLDPDAELAF